MSSKYNIWLTFDRDMEKLRLPVNPETISISDGSKNDSIDIAGLGEVTILQDRPALSFSWSCFFPKTYFPGVKYGPPSPLKCVDKIRAWKRSKNPVKLVITGLKINLYCSIEQFDISEDGGDVGTIHYTIRLKEYRAATIRKLEVAADGAVQAAGSEERVDNGSQPQTYTVKSGDCLFNIAKAVYGDGAAYIRIYEANKDVIGGNPNKIKSGQVLVIPE